jgi:ABC-type sugar transport system ATPase subunit
LASHPPEGLDVIVGVRPTDLDLASQDRADVVGVVEVAEPLGSTTLLHVRAAASTPLLRILVSGDAGITAGQAVGAQARRDRLHFFDRRSGQRLD